MRVYISGPIRGTGDYAQRFEDAEYELREHGFKPINPVKADAISDDLTIEERLKIDLLLLGMCDAIYMLRGWEGSCGANREFGYAAAKDMMIMREADGF